MSRSTRVAGHGMPHEGRGLRWSAQFESIVYDPDSTRTRCECGEWSPELPTDAARRRWHATHKAVAAR